MTTGYFEESPGVRSSTRVNSFILLIFLIVFDFTLAIGGMITAGAFTVTSTFVLFNFVMLLGVFAPKYLAKLLEVNVFKTTAAGTAPKPQTRNDHSKSVNNK